MKKILILGTVFVLSLGGCFSSQAGGRPTTMVVREAVSELDRDPVPGTVNDVWVEPMADTIRVPGKLDPKGVYLIKPHTTVVEIRHERFQQVQYPEDRPGVGETSR